jgi:hypothetical protein
MTSSTLSPSAASAALSAARVDADAQAATGDEHGAAGEVGAVEAAGHPHLAAAAEVADELVGDIQDRKAAGLVLAPLTDPPVERHRHGS